MVKGSNNIDLQQKNVDSKYFYFFQLWQELTDSRTLDSYQFKIMNLLSILEETCDVINKFLDGAYKTTHNIDACRIEAISFVNHDIILEKYYKPIQISLLKILKTSPKTEHENKALIYHINYVLNSIAHNYMNYLVDELDYAINNNDKNCIQFCTKNILSILATKGWTTKSLFSKIKILHKSATEDKWTKFKQFLLLETSQTYKVYIPVKLHYSEREDINNKIQDLFNNPNLRIRLKTGDEIIDENLPPFKIIQSEERYVEIEIEAYDLYSAAIKGIKLYSNLLNSLSFFNIIRPWSLNYLSCIVKNEDNSEKRQFKPYDLYGTYDYFEGANSLFDLSKSITGNDKSKICKKLLSTYSYTNVGRAAYSQEEKFMNIWVALESLCKTDMCPDIISNILDNVTPTLCSRYIFSLVRNFSEDCIRCNVDYCFTTKQFEIKNTIKRTLVEDTISIFNDPSLYHELEIKCNVNELLLERCKELHTLVSNIDNMIKRVELHYTTVRQQLARLYRIRNQIAHTAMDSNRSLILYTEHLYDYLSTFVAEVLNYQKNNNIDNIPEIFSMIQDNYSAFSNVKTIKDRTCKERILKNFIKLGIIDLI